MNAIVNVCRSAAPRNLSVQYESIRMARRKPRHLPMAKSKMFRVPERKRLPEEENSELLRLHNNYKTYVKSIRAFLKQELEKSASASEQAQEELRREREQHVLCMKENDAWNVEVAKLRAVRLAKQELAEKEAILDAIIKHEQQEKEYLEKVEDIVSKEKERSKHYITPENIDEAIEKALDNEVDYNFSLDVDGTVYHGRMTKPDIARETREKMVVSNRS
ncbi:probable 28S ribosomal protein S26, mitochondrial [Schistocerca serialis cubense]|uniref:probable 28S ribosomal protein S26, mitochondrial n=1 Tax=Schistocerca serialis cubense TaxID=2023355 RepID=UPI00214E6C6B|nr:probable 28S ribosomal protein S26, mitochondrial [Schistocerca serialis cubense]